MKRASSHSSRRPEAPTPFARILVGSVPTEQSADARALTVQLAAPCDAEVVLVSVIQALWLDPVGGQIERAVMRRGEREHAAEALNRAAKAISQAPGSHRVEQRLAVSSSPARGLHDAAVSEHADLIVVGSSHRGPVGRVFPGSVAERLLTGAPCAVAVAPRGHATDKPGPLDNIMVAFDGSPEARLALHTAHALAAHTGAGLSVVMVIVPSSPGVAVGEAIPLPGLDMLIPPADTEHGETVQLAEALKRQQSAARATLEATTAALHAGADVEWQILVGPDPATMILEAAHDHADLLVLGSRAYGPLRRTLLGSISNHVIRDAPCPVIVTPRAGEHPK